MAKIKFQPAKKEPQSFLKKKVNWYLRAIVGLSAVNVLLLVALLRMYG